MGYSAAGDVYKIQIADDFVELTTFVKADPPSLWTMLPKWWTSLSESSQGISLPVAVQRSNGGVVRQPAEQSWRIAPGSLRGTIYYWTVGDPGKTKPVGIMKIKPGASSPVPAFDPGLLGDLGSPPPASGYDGTQPPWANDGNGKRCAGCHTVSRDGSAMAVAFHTAVGQPLPSPPRFAIGVIDLASEKVTAVGHYNPAPYVFKTLSAKATHMVSDTQQATLTLVDPKTGLAQPSSLDALTSVVHPQFSPDDKLLAFVSNANSGEPGGACQGDLSLFDVALGSPPSFTNQRVLLPGGSDATLFPDFTPDSKWVVFQRGKGCAKGAYDLFMVDVQGASQQPLGPASGAGVLGPKDQSRNYRPHPAPVAAGGYFWLVFFSPRSYGARHRNRNRARSPPRHRD